MLTTRNLHVLHTPYNFWLQLRALNVGGCIFRLSLHLCDVIPMTRLCCALPPALCITIRPGKVHAGTEPAILAPAHVMEEGAEVDDSEDEVQEGERADWGDPTQHAPITGVDAPAAPVAAGTGAAGGGGGVRGAGGVGGGEGMGMGAAPRARALPGPGERTFPRNASLLSRMRSRNAHAPNLQQASPGGGLRDT